MPAAPSTGESPASNAASIERVSAEWRRLDCGVALGATDREAIETTESIRHLIVRELATQASNRDLVHAAARYGRLLAELDASPSIAAATVRSLDRAMPGVEIPTAVAAAIAEGFAMARTDAARRSAEAAWDLKRAVVRLSESEAAVAAGHPSDDPDTLARWADRLMSQGARLGLRRVVVSGREPAVHAIADAAKTVGIAVKIVPAFGQR